jgi:hypothetical protein
LPTNRQQEVIVKFVGPVSAAVLLMSWQIPQRKVFSAFKGRYLLAAPRMIDTIVPIPHLFPCRPKKP